MHTTTQRIQWQTQLAHTLSAVAVASSVCNNKYPWANYNVCAIAVHIALRHMHATHAGPLNSSSTTNELWANSGPSTHTKTNDNSRKTNLNATIVHPYNVAVRFGCMHFAECWVLSRRKWQMLCAFRWVVLQWRLYANRIVRVAPAAPTKHADISQIFAYIQCNRNNSRSLFSELILVSSNNTTKTE